MQTSGRIVRSLSGAWQVREEEEADARLRHPASAALLDLRALLLLIPDYDGCSHRLELFAHAVRHVASSLPPSADQRTLLLALAGKLHGRAHAYFEYRLHRFHSVDEFLGDLYSYFSGLGSELWLLDELHTVRQRGDETVAEFATRLDRLAGQICAIYDAQQEPEAATEAEGSSNEAREANKKLVRDVALASFRRGLRSTELEMRVGVCQPQRLEEAIRLAIAGENELRFREKLLMVACRRSTTDSSATKKRRYR